jgi:hypothetical protein
MLTSSENLPLGNRANCTSISHASTGSLILHVSHASQDGTRRNNPSEPTRSIPPEDFLQNVTGSALPLPNKGRLCCDDVKAECCWSVISQASASPTLAPKMDPSITATITAVVCPQCVRPVNGIFKAKEGFGKIDRGAVLTCLSSSSHTTTPSSDASQMPPGGARDDPGLGWEKTGSGLRDGQASAASPDRRNDCHRSGSSSSIRRAGWVLIRSSTSRR